jgi:phosphoadenosine phosphosulfate reductase
MPKISLSPERIKALEEKIAKSKEIYKQAFDRFDSKDTRIVWSGGKDSTLMLWIGLQYCKENNIKVPTCFTIDEFDVFVEIDAMLKVYAERWDLRLDWGLNIDVVENAGWQLDNDVTIANLTPRNQKEIFRMDDEFRNMEKFPFEAESLIGNHLMKSVVVNQYIQEHKVKAIFQGLRWDEQPERKNDPYLEDVTGDGEFTPEHARYRPILHFTERDIWDTTLYFDIPFCPLYKEGYRSLGAKTTSRKSDDPRPAWEQDLENTVERAGRRQDKEAAMARLRRLGYM